MKNILLLLFLPLNLFSQNLVLNPSFEDTVSLNQFINNYHLCKDWVNPNAATTDYFSPYCQELGFGNGYCSPQTFVGYQQAQDGEAYIGLIVWEANNHPTKEYAQGFLSQPLVAGKKYNVSMYINMADSSNYKSCEIEIAFTNSLIYSNTFFGSFNFTDTIKFDISNIDTTSWVLLSSTYIATGGEEFIYIGSNTQNIDLLSCIDTLPYGFMTTQAAYYLIDNVSVIENTELTVPNVFTPNSDGVNDVFKTEGLIESDMIQIFNRWGIKVFETNGNAAWNGQDISGQSCSGGIYYYVIQGIQNKTGFIQIIN